MGRFEEMKTLEKIKDYMDIFRCPRCHNRLDDNMYCGVCLCHIKRLRVSEATIAKIQHDKILEVEK